MSEVKDKVPFTMEEIFDFMQIDYGKYARGQNSFNIPCPICDKIGTSRHLNVNLAKKKWRCPKCGSGGNGVNFYHFVNTGYFELSKEEYTETIAELNRLMKGDTAYQKRRAYNEVKWKSEPKIKTVPIAEDDILHQTFSQLLDFKALSLLDEHRENLLARGLDEEAIEKNGYRSFPAGIQMKDFIRPDIKAAYEKNNWGKIKNENPRLKHMSDFALMMGLTVADWLKSRGCQMRGVPGFFRFFGHWCFLFPPKGIAIPTRNMKGQIVALQARTDIGRLRYMTVSAKGLELAVEENISRVHWPLGNDALDPSEDGNGTEVIVTEGPLKADVALHLLKQNELRPKTAFVAMLGIMNTNSLLRDCEYLKELGYKQLTNAFDMDRLTNPNVLKGSVRLRTLLKEKGIVFSPLFWDKPTAIKTAEAQRKVCVELGVALPEKVSQNPFIALAQYTQALASEGDAARHTVEWDKHTKGIDDFLFVQSQKS